MRAADSNTIRLSFPGIGNTPFCLCIYSFLYFFQDQRIHVIQKGINVFPSMPDAGSLQTIHRCIRRADQKEETDCRHETDFIFKRRQLFSVRRIKIVL